MEAFQLPIPMSFEGGSASFVAKHRQASIWPSGSTRTMMVDNQPVHRPEPYVEFNDHKFATTDKYTVRGLVMESSFLDPQGYFLDVLCLPKELRAPWGRFPSDVKRKVCLALIDGRTAAEILASLSPEVAAIPAPAEVVPAEPPVYECPVPGCGIRVEGEPDEAKARYALFEHQRLVHPEWGA